MVFGIKKAQKLSTWTLWVRSTQGVGRLRKLLVIEIQHDLIYQYIYIHTYMYVYIYICVYAHIYVYVIYLHMYMYIHVHVYIYIYACKYVCICYSPSTWKESLLPCRPSGSLSQSCLSLPKNTALSWSEAPNAHTCVSVPVYIYIYKYAFACIHIFT